MTSIPANLRAEPTRFSYARKRLLLGITGVGTVVLLALATLTFRLPARVLSTSAAQPAWAAIASVTLTFAAMIVALMQFDLIGGAWLVHRRVMPPAWLARWARGAGVQLLVFAVSVTLLLSVARRAGAQSVMACTVAFVLLQLALATLRGRMARLVGAMRVVPAPPNLIAAATSARLDASRITCVDVDDEGYVGGWSGIGARKLIVPLHWASLSESALMATLVRRRIIGESGAHTRGVIGAMVWNSIGFVAVLALTGATMATAAGVVTAAAGMTLWAFLGVLVLPTPSRAAVVAVDLAAAAEVGELPMRMAIEQLDRWQDDEPVRPRAIETIFHPVPERSARIARLVNARVGGRVRVTQAHHLARHALWLSWASLSPIARLVHCNVGRPALWVMLPGD